MFKDTESDQELICIDAGLTSFDTIHDLQLELFKELIGSYKSSVKNYLILCEHEPVYTLGKSGDIKNILNKEIQHKVKRIDRGGDITFHGPGQLVGYPILNLSNFKLGLKSYVDLLEDSIIRTLSMFEINAKKSPNEIGVWLDPNNDKARKICALGIRSSRFITMHGFALNVNTDLTYYEQINPCGLTDKEVSSMAKELGTEVDFEDVKACFLTEFINALSRNFKEV
ncbi:MAG: lipoyl(octanoyl) transferase LipB [Chitinophagales bacterium]|nr:lipoyl(octanoyl) transferase LipB [Chitinophagales bacterium]